MPDGTVLPWSPWHYHGMAKKKAERALDKQALLRIKKENGAPRVANSAREPELIQDAPVDRSDH